MPKVVILDTRPNIFADYGTAYKLAGRPESRFMHHQSNEKASTRIGAFIFPPHFVEDKWGEHKGGSFRFI
jgi:hypothetical protein